MENVQDKVAHQYKEYEKKILKEEIKEELKTDVNFIETLSVAVQSRQNDALFNKTVSQASNSTKAAKDAAETAKNEAETAKEAAETAKNEAIDAANDAKQAAGNAAKVAETTATKKAKYTAIKEAEAVVNNTVFTAFGTFATIIAIIISLVLTSSTWLSSADKADAAVAFILPSSIAIIAVLVLLGVVFFHSDSISEKNEKRLTVFYCVIALLIIGLIIAMCFYTIEKIEIVDHVRYIRTSEDYEIIDDDNGRKCYEFMVEGQNHRFPVSDEFDHNGEIWYCREHDELE